MSDSGATTGSPPLLRMFSTTPIQSYVSSSRMPSASECGSSHTVITSAQCCAGWSNSSRPIPPTRERCASGGLHGMESCRRCRRDEDVAHTCGERAAAHLHEHPVEFDPEGGGLVEHLPPDRPAAVEAERVLGALHGERDRPGVDGLAEPEHRRVTGRIGHPAVRSGGSSRPRRSRRTPTPSSIQMGTNTSIGQSAAAARVAAASAALPHEAIASRGRSASAPTDSAARRCSRIDIRWRALWLPATLCVSSFTHTPPAGPKPSSSERAADLAKGVTRNPTPSTRPIAESTVSVSAWRGIGGHPVRCRERRPRQALVVPHERVRVLVNFLRTRVREKFTRTKPQDVVPVGRGRVRAAERERVGDVAARRRTPRTPSRSSTSTSPSRPPETCHEVSDPDVTCLRPTLGR